MKPTVQSDGSLSLAVGEQYLSEGAPYVYQERNAAVVAVAGHYVVDAAGSVRFDLGAYDHTLPLIIDPVLSFSTLLAGNGFSAATAIAVDAAGAAYITGYTASYNLLTANPEQNFNAGDNDAFIAKLNPAGNALEYCTYLGGSADDQRLRYSRGRERVSLYCGLYHPHRTFPPGTRCRAASPGRATLLWRSSIPRATSWSFSTYLGGNTSDTAYGIAVDSAGNSYLTSAIPCR